MDKAPLVIEFKGFSKSGKTSSIISLIRYLTSKGYCVSSIKHIHIENFSIDKPGKNTYEMSKAGADPVVSLSSNESAFILKRRLELEEIIAKISLFSEGLKKQVIFCEGFYDGKYPLVICLRNIEDFYNLLEIFSQKPDSERIFKSLSCICGILAGNVIKENKIESFREDIRNIVQKFFSNTKKKFNIELINHLKEIPIKDLKENPQDFEKIFLV